MHLLKWISMKSLSRNAPDRSASTAGLVPTSPVVRETTGRREVNNETVDLELAGDLHH